MQKPSTIICTFPNISPINTIEEGIQQGHYSKYEHYITNKTVPLVSATGAKNLHVIRFGPVGRSVTESGCVSLLTTLGKQPCRNAPAYLVGLMAAVPEGKMPEELRNIRLIAVEPDNEFSSFTDEHGLRCLLHVYRYGVHRELNLLVMNRDRFWYSDCAILAEDI